MAVSGGADSMCLLGLMHRLHDGPILAVTLDHGLRSEASDECELARAHAASLGIPCMRLSLAVAPGSGVQERARTARLGALERVARDEGCAAIATGHTATDQAETVLFRLARGTGRTGALGMAPRRGSLVRPLLVLTREETRAWCASRGVAFADDPSNRDEASARVRIRTQLLPALARVHPGAERHVAAFAEGLADEAALIAPLVDEAWSRCERDGGLVVEALRREPPALRRLLVRRLVGEAGLGPPALERSRVERVLALGGGAVQLPGGTARVRMGVLMVRADAPAPDPVALPVPGRVEFGERAVSARRGHAEAPTPQRVAIHPPGALTVRPPQAGDRLPLPGGEGRQAVGRLLATAGVPAAERHRVPVVACGDRVLWVVGHRADPSALASPGSEALLLEVAER